MSTLQQYHVSLFRIEEKRGILWICFNGECAVPKVHSDLLSIINLVKCIAIVVCCIIIPYRAESYPVTWEWFEPIRPDEVDRVLKIVSILFRSL